MPFFPICFIQLNVKVSLVLLMISRAVHRNLLREVKFKKTTCLGHGSDNASLIWKKTNTAYLERLLN